MSQLALADNNREATTPPRRRGMKKKVAFVALGFGMKQPIQSNSNVRSRLHVYCCNYYASEFANSMPQISPILGSSSNTSKSRQVLRPQIPDSELRTRTRTR
eukprot:Gregarina_sp_Poly_1__1087@NODE_1266_length_4566_cov_27_360302_g861_i0_p7_GENE_NODE_1266_length_4566_cov_27_360302_g861_i0NODE_1266_length_4566_cov_27_360302_g861_i0_p7_ORF_typecomplete_len102_score11_65_NODE_1266_length_4566_cov_27_360302_g861_i023782683